MMIAATAALAALGVLAVVGAFTGDDEAREMFTSWPLVAFWFLLCGLLAAGFIVFGSFRRRIGMAAMHVGCVLVIAGSMWSSQAGHELQGWLGIDKAPRGCAILESRPAATKTMLYDERLKELPVEAAARLVSTGMAQPFAELPFQLRLQAFRTDLYPPENGPWVLLLDMFFQGLFPDAHITVQEEIDLANRVPMHAPAAGITLQVLSVTPAIYDGLELTQRPAVVLELTRGERRKTLTITPEQGAARAGRALIPLYDSEQDWLAHHSPAIILARPDVARNFHTDVSVHRDGRQVASHTISVNHPLHYGGYHFYFTNIDADEQHVLVAVVSDSGWLAVWIGFACITGGAVWRFWLTPLWRAARRGAS